MRTQTLMHWCAACLCGLAAGCSTTDLLKLSRHDFPMTGPDNPVVQVMALWQPAEGVGIDSKLTRGFAGQIYFISQKEAIPAQVDGTVRIYVFDDQGTVEEQAKPIHQFDFPPEAWKARMQPGKLGPTYTVFIPYTRKGRHEAQCSLRVRFVPHEHGPTTYSDLISLELPGTPHRKSRTPADSGSSDENLQPDDDAMQSNANSRAKKIPGVRAVQPPEAGSLIAARRVAPATPTAALKSESAVPRAAVPLTAEETERIVRETMAKLQAGAPGPGATPVDGPVVQAKFEQVHPLELDADEQRTPAPRRLPNPLAGSDES